MTFLKHDQHDEWFIGKNLPGTRQYLIHSQRPLFVAEIIEDADRAAVVYGFCFAMPKGYSLTNFAFFGDVPSVTELLDLLFFISEALAEALT